MLFQQNLTKHPSKNLKLEVGIFIIFRIAKVLSRISVLVLISATFMIWKIVIMKSLSLITITIIYIY